VPDEVVVEMVKSRLAQRDVQANGWLLDGYPRSASQAEAIEKEGIRPDTFILIEVCEHGCGCGVQLRNAGIASVQNTSTQAKKRRAWQGVWSLLHHIASRHHLSQPVPNFHFILGAHPGMPATHQAVSSWFTVVAAGAG
jgi:hypothetical protein